MADMTTKILTIDLNADKAINGIINLNNAIEKNTSDMKANSDMIAENNKKMKEGTGDVMRLTAQNQRLAQANVELEAKTKALKEERRILQKETQDEIKIQTQELGSMKQLEAELRKLKLEYKQLGEEERIHGARGIELRESINKTTAELKKAEYGIQEYYRNVGNYQNSILSAIGMNGRFGQSIINITNNSTSISQSFSTMGASVKAFGASLMGLLTNPVFLAIAGIAGAGMAFKWFYDYNEGLAEATRLTREFTGYSGDDLIAMRNKIQATSDVMGKEFNDTLKTADALMANFHIDGQQAMAIINKGFASGADLNGDMLSKIQQLAPTFHDAGIEADQMVAIISQTRSGIFTDQGLEAIKQGSARIREMSDSTKKALQGIGIDADEMSQKLRDGSMTTFDAVKQVSNALKDMPDNAQEVGNVMSAVFGRQGKFASQEMIESLGELSTSLDEVTAKTGEYGELLLENIDTEEELDNVTSALFDMTDKGWEEAKQKATIYAKKALVAVVKGIVDICNWFVRLYNQSLVVRAGTQYIILGFKQLWNAAKLVIGLVITGFKNIGRMIEAWVKAFNIAGQAIKGVAEGIAGVFRGIWNLDADEIMNAIGKIKSSAVDGAKGVVSAFGDAWKQGMNDLKGNFTDFVSESVENVKTAMGNMNSTLNEVHIPAWAGGDGEGGGGGGTSTGGGNGSSSSGGGSRGNSGGGSRGNTNKPSTNTTKTEKTPEEIALEQYNKRVEALVKKGEELHRKALEEQSKTSLKAIEELAEMQRQKVYELYGDRSNYEGKALEAWDAMMQEIEDKRLQAIKAYNDQLKKEEQDKANQLNKEAQQLAQAILAGQEDGTAKQREYRLKILQMQLDAELAELDANEEAKTNRREWWEEMRTATIEKYRKQQTDIEKEYAQKQKEIEISKLEASSQVAGAMSQLLEGVTEDNKEALVMSKMLAVGEIMISQAVAIANAVKAGSNAVTPWQMIAQIATSITAVTVAMAQAFKSLDEAKFATGGYIRGAGTSTSDSIPVRVSNGESIMNANTTAMFGGLLSSLNQLGGGVPIQVQQTASSVRGEDMLARAVARGVAKLPNPVVSVQDINQGQRQVEVMNERAML